MANVLAIVISQLSHLCLEGHHASPQLTHVRDQAPILSPECRAFHRAHGIELNLLGGHSIKSLVELVPLLLARFQRLGLEMGCGLQILVRGKAHTGSL